MHITLPALIFLAKREPKCQIEKNKSYFDALAEGEQKIQHAVRKKKSLRNTSKECTGKTQMRV